MKDDVKKESKKDRVPKGWLTFLTEIFENVSILDISRNIEI